DTTGNLAVKCIYDKADDFKGGYAKVSLNGKYGFINKSGQVIIPFEYDDAGFFSEGLVWVKKDGHYGYIDNTNNYVIPPEYSDAQNFSQGLAAVCKDGKYGYIDRSGNTVIDFNFLWADEFSEDFAGVQAENTKCGYINLSGSYVIPAEYDHVYPFSCGRGIVYKKGKYAAVNSAGEITIPFGNHSYMFSFSEGLSRARSGGMWEGFYSYVDSDDNSIISSVGPDCGDFSEGLAWVRRNTNYGFTRTYIDRNGNIILPNRSSLTEFSEYDKYFSVLHDFSEGYAAVETEDGKLGFIKNPLYSKQ
ncbi:MAG: WG repeat-containing protein, partial [Monoglobaceae bacterium]